MLFKSSSFHSLNMDRGKPSRRAISLWMWLNRVVNGLRPEHPPAWLTMRNFSVPWSEEVWARQSPKASPARRWSDFFWAHLPWARLRENLGPLRLLDLGCGDGRYALLWEELSGGLDHYEGVDTQPRSSWHELSGDTKRRFHAADIVRFLETASVDANLWLSQSALEHFPGDIRAMSLLHRSIAARGRPAVQIHLVPSAACLDLYRQHGVRQYTPRSVARLLRACRDDSRCTVFRLGGPASNQVYRDWIRDPLLTSGRDGRDRDTAGYEAACRDAARRDMETPGREPSFLAVVVEHGLPESLFAGLGTR